MKIPVYIKCSECEEEDYYFISVDDHEVKAKCKCGYDISGFFDNSFTTGVKLLFKSKYEYLNNKDFSLSIVLSAMAFECEMSRLFIKWKDIESIRQRNRMNDEELEELLRSFGSIDIKIEIVAKLMYSDGIIEFIKKNENLSNTINDGFKTITINNFPKDVKKELFWKRNRVLHLAKSDYFPEDAKVCFNISQLGLMIFAELDKYRINTI